MSASQYPSADSSFCRAISASKLPASSKAACWDKSEASDLVAFAVTQINIMQATAVNSNACPRVLFTGLKVQYKELELTFGD